MANAKLFLTAILAILVFALPGASEPAPSMSADAEMAVHIAKLLGEKFKPDSVVVNVKESLAYAEMKGAVVSKIRIDTMRLEALLTSPDQSLSNDAKALASLIGFSRGEIMLTEKDVNAYFDGNDIRGFSKLKFDFSPKGFRAEGLFSADFIFKINIRLAAQGVLALKPDGVYLDKAAIFVEGMKQPDMLTNKIVSRVNPLLEWSDIPFKVEFKKISMDEDAAHMTGNPKKFPGGGMAKWKR